MRAKDFLTEKKKRKNKLRGYFFPGYSYNVSDGSGEGSVGDGVGGESVYESPEIELAKKLPSLEKHDYDTIDQLMRKISKKHKITGKALHDLFVKKYKSTPDHWIKNKLDETDKTVSSLKKEVDNFAKWSSRILHVKNMPTIELSMDTEEAQSGHHTGSHTEGEDSIWVYAKNRNLVDILRTVFHELVHVRQGELDMIKPNSSYPGSPIESMADMLAGKYIKIYGEKNRQIFQ